MDCQRKCGLFVPTEAGNPTQVKITLGQEISDIFLVVGKERYVALTLVLAGRSLHQQSCNISSTFESGFEEEDNFMSVSFLSESEKYIDGNFLPFFLTFLSITLPTCCVDV